MTLSEKEYFAQRSKQIERRKRLVTIISVVSFGGSLIFGGVNAVKQAWEKPQVSAAVELPQAKLQKQAGGYELVLQREPNNRMALERLSLIRLDLGDKKGAIALMERLVKLHPDRQDYKNVLENTKKQQ